MLREMDHSGLLRADVPPELVPLGYWRPGIFLAAFLVSIPIALVSQLAYLCWLAMPVATRLARIYLARRLAGPASGRAPSPLPSPLPSPPRSRLPGP
jgi:hypothetical protein